MMDDKPTTMIYGASEGINLHADVFAYDTAPRPVIVYLHGGALIMGSRTGAPDSLVALCRSEGYALVSIDYRLAPETKLPAILDDIQAAFRWVREDGPKLFGADPARIAAVGHSAGGYLSLLAGHRVSPRPTIIVSYYGYGDIMGPWYSRPDPFYCTHRTVAREEAYAVVQPGPVTDGGNPRRGAFYLYCRQQGCWPQEVMGANPDTAPEDFTPFCPERHVTADYPPTLLLHGDQDTDVPYSLSVSMSDALARAGVTHEFITITGSGHGFVAEAENPQVVAAEARVNAFLHHYLREDNAY